MTDTIRVLLLEDDPADARLVGQMLRRVKPTSFEVTVAGRLVQALERLSRAPDAYDVVLADLSVPDSSGIATLNALTAAAPHLPVVVLTGNDDDAIAMEALKRGAQDYLVKGMGDAFILSRVVRYAIERKLGEAALREARDSAERAARAKSVFLAMMGHEIRTPLNGVLGMTRLLLETPLDHLQRSYAQTLASSAELLLGLVNDVLDFARLDASGLTLDREPFDLVATVEEVRLLLAPRAVEKGLDLEARYAPSLPRTVLGDRLRLRQILFNLVGNAIKFTDHGHVSIRAEPLPLTGVRITVSDTGIGIDDVVKPHLFTEFWQGESGSARRFAGAGLGLAISRRLARLMGGDIGCDSTLGQGSVFRVELPLPPADTAAMEQPDSHPASPAVPCRILLVDDNEVNRAVAEGLLQQRGHTVVSACDGISAVEIARHGDFDLALLDMRMPGLDGIETARAIRALPGPAGQIPLYLLTANPQREDEPRWREAGILGCLAKPFRMDDFSRILSRQTRSVQPPPLAGSAPPPRPQHRQLLAAADLRMDMDILGRERMTGLVDLFRRSSGMDLEQLRAVAAASRWDEAAQIAHRMAGAAFSLHLGELAARCRSLENAARSKAPDTAAQAMELADLWRLSVDTLDRALREE